MSRNRIGVKLLVVGLATAPFVTLACSSDSTPSDGGSGASGGGMGGSSGVSGSNPGGGGSSGSAMSGAGGGSSGAATGGSSGSSGQAGQAGSDTGTAGASGLGGDTGAGGAGGDGSGDAGMAGMAGAPSIIPDVLDNPGFEVGTSHSTMPGWTNVGDTDAAYIEYSGPRTGFGRLGHWLATAYTVSTFQLVGPIPNGTYTFSMWVTRDTNFADQHLFARNYSASSPSDEMTMSTDAASSSGYTQIVLSGIPVTNGQVEVGIASTAALDGVWANIDDAELTLEP